MYEVPYSPWPHQQNLISNFYILFNLIGDKSYSHALLFSWGGWTHQLSPVTQSCPTLCDPMDCSTPGFPVYRLLPKLAQTHVHWISDAIQTSHPRSSLSPPAFNLSQHQGLFKWVSSSHQVDKVLELQLQHQSFQWVFRNFLADGLVESPGSPRDSQESSPTPQFKSISSSVFSFLYNPTLTSIYDYWKNHSFD